MSHLLAGQRAGVMPHTAGMAFDVNDFKHEKPRLKIWNLTLFCFTYETTINI